MTATASKLAPKQLRDRAIGDRTSLAPKIFILKKPHSTHSHGKIEFHIQQRKTHHAAIDISSP
ncbi:hypothetical protein Q5692_20355 [Microcoleus sp. C2C3]|uniref:hypothetical protein n=1 Tax=unclassified Microcoleus TaxID=2642155 RepID=UPI002FD44AEC